MKPGTYYIGDPCYVIKNDEWRALLERTDFLNDEFFEYRGHACFASSTAYGDGSYEDNSGREYMVDAGLIGIMPLQCLSKNKSGIGGNIVTISHEFTPEVSNGVFKFAEVVIDTR